MDTTAYELFQKSDHGQTLSFEHGPFLVTCSAALGSWGWVLWREGVAVAGRRSWQMDAFEACSEAYRAVERGRGALGRQPGPDAPGEAVAEDRAAGPLDHLGPDELDALTRPYRPDGRD